MALFHLSSWQATQPQSDQNLPCGFQVAPTNEKEGHAHEPPEAPVQNTKKNAWFKIWEHVVSAACFHLGGLQHFVLYFFVHFEHLQQHMIHLGRKKKSFLKIFFGVCFLPCLFPPVLQQTPWPLVKWQPFPLKISTGQVLVNLYGLGGRESAV